MSWTVEERLAARAAKFTAMEERIRRRAERRDKRRAEAAETRRFLERLRFDQSKFWDENREPEARSLMPSSWSIFEAACRKWGIPAGLRSIPQLPIGYLMRGYTRL